MATSQTPEQMNEHYKMVKTYLLKNFYGKINVRDVIVLQDFVRGCQKAFKTCSNNVEQQRLLKVFLTRFKEDLSKNYNVQEQLVCENPTSSGGGARLTKKHGVPFLREWSEPGNLDNNNFAAALKRFKDAQAATAAAASRPVAKEDEEEGEAEQQLFSPFSPYYVCPEPAAAQMVPMTATWAAMINPAPGLSPPPAFAPAPAPASAVAVAPSRQRSKAAWSAGWVDLDESSDSGSYDEEDQEQDRYREQYQDPNQNLNQADEFISESADESSASTVRSMEVAPDFARAAMPFNAKTKLCRHFMAGFCFKDQACTYAHGYEELRAVPNLHKTELCILFKKYGCCKHGSNCHFAHGEGELRRQTNEVPPQRVPQQVPSVPSVFCAPIVSRLEISRGGRPTSEPQQRSAVEEAKFLLQSALQSIGDGNDGAAKESVMKLLVGIQSGVFRDARQRPEPDVQRDEQPSNSSSKVPELVSEACVVLTFAGELDGLDLSKLEIELNHLVSLSTKECDQQDYDEFTIVEAVGSTAWTPAGTAGTMTATTTATLKFADSRTAEEVFYHCIRLPYLGLTAEYFPYLHRVQAVSPL